MCIFLKSNPSPLPQDVLTRGSAVLYTATHHRIFIRRVTVVIPENWNGGACPWPEEIAPRPSQTPVISIGPSHPVYGDRPWTLQVGGCGQPGKMIYLTPQFLKQHNHTASYSGENINLPNLQYKSDYSISSTSLSLTEHLYVL